MSRYKRRLNKLEKNRIDNLRWLPPVVIVGTSAEVEHEIERLERESLPHGPIVCLRIHKTDGEDNAA